MSVLVSGYLKTSLVEIASAVERMVLPVDPNIEKDQVNDAENLIIHDRLILHPFSPKAVNNFNSSPPFGLCDIFNYLIYQSTAYIAAAMCIHPPSRPPLHLHLAWSTLPRFAPLPSRNKPEIVVLLSFIRFDFHERPHFGYIYMDTLLIQLSS